MQLLKKLVGINNNLGQTTIG